MKRNSMIIAICAMAAAAFTACGESRFGIEGTISNAKDSMLYLENMSLDGPVKIDSVKLDEDGTFSFGGERPEAPEFYRLRIAAQIINISIDSTETVTVTARYPEMASQYTVEGSENCLKIKELTLRQMSLQQKAIEISRNPMLGIRATEDSIRVLVEAYKDDVKKNYIFKEPMKAYAYFALFQTLGNAFIFNPRTDTDDVKVFGAVATSWDTYHPNTLRGQNLHNITIEGMKNRRILQNRNAEIDMAKVNTSNIINISLADNRGVVRQLTDLNGKVVFLDFHLFASEKSTERIMMLRELYGKYHDRGLEIFQVALDEDEHFWKQQTAALPWICVRAVGDDAETLLMKYNVRSIPTFFLVDRSNMLYKRDVQMKDFEKELQTLL
ncbi:MAG: DUF4369 domain-containing protein [Prevotella sp.]|uniref:DUF4369 domain-containing protein n=1 Tax=Prevotella sp. TaxID=59823 RepID=UPI002A35748C|nr:DUF4369 domain-containing protein [Prevotella sp.]MDD7317254.1 DUF4369 domain-containing protein [Prevotellaceae bacterium]MDY4019858.1 DUF4369 domain-containing protein [Prevotella sp.]